MPSLYATNYSVDGFNNLTDPAQAAESVIHSGAACEAVAGKRLELLAMRTLASRAIEEKAGGYIDAFDATGRAASFDPIAIYRGPAA